jgi:hypothetical protein
MQRGQVVLVDTNIIIEAVRTNCWSAMSGYFTMETVEKCLEDLRRRDYVKVDPAQLKKGLSKVHKVSSAQAAAFAIAMPNADELDPGERQLFAHALGRADAWVGSCADRNALRAAFGLSWKDRFVSLEVLAQATGARPDLKQHYRERWLSDVRTGFLLEKGLP